MRRLACSRLLTGLSCGAGRPVSRRQKLRKQRPACEAGGLRPDGGTGGGRRSAAWRRNWRRQAVCGLTAELAVVWQTAADNRADSSWRRQTATGGGWQAADSHRRRLTDGSRQTATGAAGGHWQRLAELRVDFSHKLCYSVLNRQEGYG